MAKITATGIEQKTLTEYLDSISGLMRSRFGAELSLDPETPQGQLRDLLAIAFAEVDEAIVSMGSQFSIHNATGTQLDDHFTLLDIRRKQATFSTVLASLAGDRGAVVPLGTRFRTAAGDVFESVTEVTLSGDGTADVACRALVTGPIPVGAGALTEIATPVAGLNSVTNAAAGTEGADIETDHAYISRYRQTLHRNSVSRLVDIRSALLAVEGVSSVYIVENASAAAVTDRGVYTPAHSITAIIAGAGGDEDIARAIARSKGMGVGTSTGTAGSPRPRNKTVSFVNADGFNVTINFLRALVTPLVANVAAQYHDGFATTGVADMRQALSDYVNALPIGETVILGDAIKAIDAVPNQSVESITINFEDQLRGRASLFGYSDLTRDEKLTLDPADIIIAGGLT